MCEYCNIDKYENYSDGIKRLRLGWDYYTSLEMWFNPKDNKFSIVAFDEGKVETELNYCHKCGRKLT